jgi:CheY-like chemotaxis protein
MSHEIRSPLNAIIGFTSLLQETRLTTEQAEYAGTLAVAASHLKDLVNGILDLSRVESGKLELEEIPFDLAACVEEAAGLVAHQAEEKGIALAVLFTPGIPEIVVGDPLRLRQILVNLLSNAVKFTGHGHVTIEVTARPAAGGRDCRLAFDVRDTGPGIPASTLDQLFDPFTQADTSITRRFGGTGLGLTICRQLAERMGGQITVESAPGQGAAFTAVVTLRQAAQAAPDRPLSGIHVLLVHSRPVVAEAARRHLAAWGATATVAPSCDAAAGRSTEWADAALAVVEAGRDPAELSRTIHALAGARGGRPLPVIGLTPLAWHRPAAAPFPVAWTVTAAPIRGPHLRAAVLGALGRPDSITEHRTALPAAAPPARHPAATKKVLYIDDNPTLRSLVGRILASDPRVSLLTAADGGTGIQLAAAELPDLILADLHLPDMNAENLIQQLGTAHHTSAIPVIIVSGDSSPATVKHLTSLGAAAYLTKPFDAEGLRAAIGVRLDGATGVAEDAPVFGVPCPPFG